MAQTTTLYRIFKFLLKIAIYLILLIGIGLAAVTTFVDPNKYKDQINSAIQSASKKNIAIEGIIEWSFTPQLGVSASNIVMKDSKNKDIVLKAKEVNINLELFPLLRKEIKVSGVTAKNIILNAQIDKNGEMNLTKELAPPPEAASTATSGSMSSNNVNDIAKDKPIADLTIKSFKLINSTVYIYDHENTKLWSVKDLNIKCSDLLIAPGAKLPIMDASFKLFKGAKEVHKLKPLLELNSNITGAFADKSLSLSRLQIINYNIGFTPSDNGGNISGNLDVNQMHVMPQIEFNAFSDNLMPEKILESLGLAKHLQGTSNLSINLRTSGKQVKFIKQNLHGNIKIYTKSGQINGVNIDAALAQLAENLESMGNTIKHENRINISGLIKQNLIDWQQFKSEQASTPIHNLQFNAEVKNGVANPTTTQIQGKSFGLQGNGVIDFNQQQLNQPLILNFNVANEHSFANFINTTPIQVNISGPFNNVQVKPDLSKFVEKALFELQKQLLKNATKNIFKNIIPGIGDKENNTDANAVKNEGSETSNPVEDFSKKLFDGIFKR